MIIHYWHEIHVHVHVCIQYNYVVDCGGCSLVDWSL